MESSDYHENGAAELALNVRGRDLVVGDLHGQFEALQSLLAMVAFDTGRDRLIAVGDLVDRGKDSLRLMELQRSAAWFHAVIGNHEALMRNALLGDSEAFEVWFANGGDWGSQLADEIRTALIDDVNHLPLTLEFPLRDGRSVGVVHAEVAPGLAWSALRGVTLRHTDVLAAADPSAAAAAIWGRRRIRAGLTLRDGKGRQRLTTARLQEIALLEQPVDEIDVVVSGHSIVSRPAEPLAFGNAVFIDTGAFAPEGRLTLFEPLTGDYWQVGPGGRLITERSQTLSVPVK